MAEEKKKKAEAAEKEEKKDAAEESEEEKEVDTSDLSDEAKDVLEKVEKMTVLELAALVEVMEDKFGVSAAAPVAVAAGGAAGGEAEEEEEKSAYDLVITEAGDQKINVIKAVREITEIGLKEAKELVESAPQTVKEAMDPEEAEEAKGKLEEAGATAELQ